MFCGNAKVCKEESLWNTWVEHAPQEALHTLKAFGLSLLASTNFYQDSRRFITDIITLEYCSQ